MKSLDLLRAQWDRAAAVALSAAGLVVLLVGFLRISDTPYPAEQLVIVLSGGVGALFLLGLGATLWLSADLRDEWVKLDELAAHDEALVARLDALTPPSAPGPSTDHLAPDLLAPDLLAAPAPAQRRRART